MKENLLEVNNLSVNYGANKIINNISFSVFRGSFVFVLSPNKSGKTTLVKALSGIICSNTGKITVNDIELSKSKIKDYLLNISVILDDIDNQFLCSKVNDELRYPLINLDYSDKDINNIVDKVSNITGLSTILGKDISRLSYLEKIKVLIAVSIVHSPKIVFIDDILRFLDKNEKKEVLKILKKINKDLGIAILLTTSDIDNVVREKDIILFNNGSIIERNSFSSIIMKDNELEKMGLCIPLMIDLSRKLQFYNLIDEIYYEPEEVINILWK